MDFFIDIERLPVMPGQQNRGAKIKLAVCMINEPMFRKTRLTIVQVDKLTGRLPTSIDDMVEFGKINSQRWKAGNSSFQRLLKPTA